VSDLSPELRNQLEQLAEEVGRMLADLQRPMVIALDGGSGAGKSTVALSLARKLGAAVIPLDDFFAADIPDRQWDRFTAEEKREKVFDWKRVRSQCIEPLLQGRPARWRAFDFESGLRPDGTYGMEAKVKQQAPADVLLIEGAYSAGPELADLADLAILVDVPEEERHGRLKEREGLPFSNKWITRWEKVERHYFEELRPRSYFDFVLYAGELRV
jgi:uridine kinase